MSVLNYNLLLSFREIAAGKSISGAAAKFRIGQPAMSGQLKKLEDQLGHKLFERKNRRLHLTEMGKFVLQCANDVHQSGSHLVEVLEKGILTSKIQLNVGALESVPKHLILQLIRDARAIADCKINLVEGRADELLKELQAHALDILISNYYAPITTRGETFSRSLSKSAISVFGTPKFKHLKHDFPASLGGHTFILPTFYSKLRHDIEHYFRNLDVNVTVFTETQDTSIQKLLALNGYGMVCLPEFSVEDLVQEKKLVKLGTMEHVHEEFWLISAKRTLVNPVANKLARDFMFFA